ncbi:MAG: ABC transporter ATP-binding protein [Azoarcus sp.]|nr:ABC transporter ATP-binding protein [Azoarcus sp.]
MLDIDISRKCYPDRGGRKHVALADLRLQVQTGEFVCVVGPSGCGKSTLLNVVGGLDSDVTGRVILDGQPPQGGIGFMFQEPRLMPWLTVLENVLLVAGDDPTAPARARDLLQAMELGDVFDAYPGRLSGGMQRRVALARAFVIEPRLLLMDEPFVSLDAPTADRLRAMLVNLWRRCNSTVLFVTHDLREALALGDRVCFMSGAPGRVVLEWSTGLTGPRSPNDAAVLALQRELLERYPELLAGLPDHTNNENDWEVRADA